ncbi:MAG: hypothetical protein ACR2K6_10325 [Solirubrobacterales bacterium]
MALLQIVAGVLPDSSSFYAVLMGFGFFLGVYAHAGRFPRLLAFAILWVFLTTVLTLVAARTFSGSTDGVELP